jgi:hypothetical protein
MGRHVTMNSGDKTSLEGLLAGQSAFVSHVP